MGTDSLEEVLQDCQTMIAPQAAASGIQISFPRFEQTCLVHAGRRRVKQVLVNLLSNAIKYNRPHGVVEVAWSLRSTARVRISVKDSGMGLAAEQLTQLFQPFNRLGQETGAQEGTGIGLVELMGGNIGVHSTVGDGSVFWFDLALAPGTP